ncbi:MAG: AEC family transporter [Bacteroidota bacterium]
MANFILIGFCILAGVLFRYRKLVPSDTHKGINVWIINIALPAVSFKYLTHLDLSSNLIIPAISPLVVFAGAILFIFLVGKFFKMNKSQHGAMQLTSGLSNTSFVGFPLILAYFSEKEISIAIICDQVTFLLFSLFGIAIAVNSTGSGKVSTGELFKKVVTFPPLLGCIAALLIPKESDLSLIEPVFAMLAATVAPLALFSVGLQLSLKGWKEEVKPMLIVLSYKLFLAPALVLSILILLNLHGTISKIAVFEAAMPVFLSATILADRYNLSPRFTNLIIGVSILLSFGTTWIWWHLVEYFL